MQKHYTAFAFALLLGMSFSYGQKTHATAPQSAEKPKPPFDPSIFYPKLDSEPPVLTCINGLSVNLMPGGQINIFTTDVLLNVTDNETPLLQIQFAIRKTGLGTGFPLDGNGAPQVQVVFDCDDLGAQDIELWAQDLAGNVSSCTTYLIVQDNAQNCTGGNGNLLCSEKYCDNTLITDVAFSAQGSSPFAPPFTFFMANNTGCMNLQSIPMASTLVFSASKDDNPLSGISGQDLQMLSDHIQGIQPFTEPWQWVAADINNDLVIDAQDSIELHNLMMGVYQELPNNSSWRFVRSDYVFPSPNPLAQPYPESFTVGEMQANPSLKFYGIKIGKLQCNAPRPAPERQASPVVEGSISIFPNPSKGAALFSFDLKRPELVYWQIRDIKGKLMREQKLQLPAGPQSIDIPAETTPAPGVYFWRLQIGERTHSGKFVRSQG